MRVPYTVGRWVRGEHHYGRQRLLQHLLAAPDNAYWVIGTRRMGKTSLLRQLELLTTAENRFLVPLYCDLQGCHSAQDFADELVFAVEDAFDRFSNLGVAPEMLSRLGAVEILRMLQRAVDGQGKQLLLLVDEAEALIHIAESDGNWLARLRRVFQDHRQRTVMTSTKMLSRLNELQSAWMTSPFLYGFQLMNLWSLDEEAAAELVRQGQNSAQVQVTPEVVAEVLHYTNHHPYLLQYLCTKLYMSDGQRQWLRPVQEEDLIPDQLLAQILGIDCRHLTTLERRILLEVSERETVSRRELFSLLSDESPARLHTFLYGLYKLGYIREDEERWTISNAYLARWLREHNDDLHQEASSQLSESQIEPLIEQGADHEREILRAEIRMLHRKLAELLDLQQSAEDGAKRDLQEQAMRVQRALADLTRQLRLFDDSSG